MRIKTTNEIILSSNNISMLAKSRITNITVINQSNAMVRVGLNNEDPYLELGENQSIAYDAGENSIWGDGKLYVNYLTATIKKIIILQTIDLGEL